MKRLLFFLTVLMLGRPAMALEVEHIIHTTVGPFETSQETLVYKFFGANGYDVKTGIKTLGTFDTLYPFSADYHAYGTYNKSQFLPQDYYYETQSRFRHRTKRIVYKNGVPQYRISTKGEKKRQDDIIIDEKYGNSNDLLSTFGELIHKIVTDGSCDFERFSFDGKHYSRSKVKFLGFENIHTPFFSGNAMKCQYHLEVLDDAEAGFMLSKDEPVYFWALQDQKTNTWFLARILVEKTPFGKMESLTTSIKVKP